MRSDDTTIPGPLAGMVVIDLTRALAGPYCTMLFADLGADVIKVEPMNGDGSRVFGPFREDDEEHAYGGYFQSVNRNKRALAVDLHSEAGRDIVFDLVETADAVIENFRPGVMDAMGLSYEVLTERNPRLVYGAIRGFGDPRTGLSPYFQRPAFDVVAQAMGGIMHITGDPDGPPTKIGPGIGDVFPAVLTAFGVMAAVVESRQSGQGRFVDVAMYDAMVSLGERIIHQQAYTGEVPGREGNDHPILCPFGIFRASDGFVAIAAPLDHQWRALCEVMGHPEMGVDPDFAENGGRRRNRDRVRATIEAWSGSLPRAQIVELLGNRIPSGPVNTVEDIIRDPHIGVREMLVSLPQPGSSTPVQVAGQPIKFTGGSRRAFTRAPLLGEHTHEILAELGYATDRIQQLAEHGSIELNRQTIREV